jgi:DNA-binding GntR family transcriptional regulator
VTVEPVRPPQLWEAVHERIRAAILAGELRAGSKLIETELAERFGTSRGPIREAIRELAREGLVVELPRRGTVVSTLTARDLAEVYAVREALELGASRSVIARASDEELQGLGTHLDAMEEAWRTRRDYLAAAEHDLAFHRALLALTGNGRMAAIYDQMLSQTMLLLRTAAEANPTLRTGIEPAVHRDLWNALLARDAERTRLALEAHYRYAEERLYAGLGDPSEAARGGGRRP